MDPLKLQQQLKNNNQDYRDFYNDLKSWGKELKEKEQDRKPKKQQIDEQESKLQEIKKPKVEDNNKSESRISVDKKEEKKKVMSYADWDKFDADKECEKIDEDSDSSSESLLEDLKDQALIEKEQGNKLVKQGKWEEAIISYTNAIKYYAYDPIFYANRALCFLKTNQMEKAEQDCNISIKIDNTYVKAYQRRAVAREALHKLNDAKLDVLRVLELEPKNTESKKKLDQLILKIKEFEQEKPVSKFHQSPQHLQTPTLRAEDNGLQTNTVSESKIVDEEKSKCIWPSGDVESLIKAIQKPPHMRSTKPLKRIPIEEINSATTSVSEEGEEKFKTFNTDDIKIVERKRPDITMDKAPVENQKKQDVSDDISVQLIAPKTSVQFHVIWKQLKDNVEKRGQYLRLVNPQKIPFIFKDSLETDVFSEILHVLSDRCTQEQYAVYEYLLNLTRIKRFGALSMFLTSSDKNSLWKLFDYIKEHEGKSKEEVNELISKYEL